MDRTGWDGMSLDRIVKIVHDWSEQVWMGWDGSEQEQEQKKRNNLDGDFLGTPDFKIYHATF